MQKNKYLYKHRTKLNKKSETFIKQLINFIAIKFPIVFSVHCNRCFVVF